MAIPLKYQAKEVLNKVLNTGEDALNVDLSDSVTVTVDSEFPAAAALADDTSNPTTTSVASHLMGYDSSNTNWNRVEVDNAGNLVVNLSATDNAVLDAMVVDLAAIEVLLTAANVDHAANEVLLGTIDADTNAIKVDMAAIEVLLTAANVDHAANEVLLTGIDADTNAIKVDMAAIEVLLTAANVDHAANEVLLTGIDADTDAIKTDMAAIEVLLTAANVDHAANEVLLGTIDSDTNDIKTATESSNTHLGNLFYDTALAVTPSDGSDLSGEPYYAVWVGTGGNLKVDMSSGTGTVTLNNVASGQLIPIMVERIYSTGTTASDIIVFK